MKILLLILLLVSPLLPQPVTAQITTASIGEHYGLPGRQVVVPLYVKGFADAASIDLSFTYDNNVVSYSSFINTAGLPGLHAHGSEWGVDGVYRVAISWSSLTPAGIEEGILIEVVFDYHGGESDFVFDLSRCEVSTLDDGNLQVVYSDGSIEPSMVGDAEIRLGSKNAVPGNIMIPLTVDFSEVEDGVGSFTFEILYDENSLSFTGIHDPALSEIQVFTFSDPTRLVLDWNNPDIEEGGSVLNGTLLNLGFVYTGGTTQLVLNEINCALGNNMGIDAAGIYHDGVITQFSADAVVQIPDMPNQKPGNVSIPIEVDFSDVEYGVGAFAFYILYDESILNFLQLEDGAALAGININQLSDPTRLVLEWINPEPQTGGSFLDGELAQMRFAYSGGTTLLEFGIHESHIANNEAIEMSAFYHPGEITQDPSTIVGVSLPDVVAPVNASVNVPLSVSNFNIIAAFDLRIVYDPNVVIFDKLDDFHNSVSPAEFEVNATISGELGISWVGGPITIEETGTLFNIVFDYGSGHTALLFDEANSQVSDDAFGEQFVSYNDGSISIDYTSGVSIPHMLGVAGQAVDIPVYATGLENLGAINFEIDFDSNVLSFIEITGLNNALAENGTSNSNVSGSRLFFEWQLDPEEPDGPTIPDDEALFFMRFTLSGGSSPLSFNTTGCAVSQADDHISPVFLSYTDGSISSQNVFTLKVLLQGLYDEASQQMRKARDSDGSSFFDRFAGTVADVITIELHEPGNYGNPVLTHNNVDLNQDGTATVTMPTSGEYYLTVKHRNHLETVSAQPIDFSTTTTYDFSTAASQAYGNNQQILASGVYGLFAGDVGQTGSITIFDRADVIQALSLGRRGYIPEDLDGDGAMTIFDRALVIQALSRGLEAITP